MSGGEHSRITFKVTCNTTFGQVVAVCGDAPGLGFFRESDAIQLVTTPEEYPVWRTASPVVVPTNRTVQYKYGIVEGGTFHAFEKRESNRTLTPSGFDLNVEDSFSLEDFDDHNMDEGQLLANLEKLTQGFEKNDAAAHGGNGIAGATGAAGGGGTNCNSNLFANQPVYHRLFLTCYHLPVVVRRIEPTAANPDVPFEVTWSESSILAKTENSFSASLDSTWIGTLSLEMSVSSEEKIVLVRILKAMNCIPIFIESTLAAGHYQGFCKQVLWPLFHNVDPLDAIHSVWKLTVGKHVISRGKERARGGSGTAAGAGAESSSLPRSSSPPSSSMGVPIGGGGGGPPSLAEAVVWTNDFYDKYLQVNRLFADVITSLIRPGDVIWVHDYHLMLLPKLLRESEDFKNCNKAADNLSAGVEEGRMGSGEGAGATAGDGAAGAGAGGSADRVRIVFFLHIPFPTTQIFRTLHRSTELLQSVTSADVIGFHSFDYTRHFLNAVKRILGNVARPRPGGLLSMLVDDREVIVTMNHVAIEPLLIQQALLHPQTRAIAEYYANKSGGRKIIVGVDSCERLSGVMLKLEAFEKFLKEDTRSSSSRGVMLLQRCIRKGARKEDEICTSSEIQHVVNSINNRYARSKGHTSGGIGGGLSGTGCGSGGSGGGGSNTAGAHITLPASLSTSTRATGAAIVLSTSVNKSSNMPSGLGGGMGRGSGSSPEGGSGGSGGSGGGIQSPGAASHAASMLKVIDYEEVSSLNLIHRVALWLVADVFLLTPLREGLNLLPMEYIYTRRSLQNAGCVVASEFSLTSSLLSGSIKVNPFNIQGVVDALDKAVYMSPAEASSRRVRDLGFISSRRSSQWVKSIFNDLMQLDIPTKSTSTTSGVLHCEPRRLNIDSVVGYFKETLMETPSSDNVGSRIFLLDYGGTLMQTEKIDIYVKQSMAAITDNLPSASVMRALKVLSDDPNNIVMISSGVTMEHLSRVFADLPNVTLLASHGMTYSWGEGIRELMVSMDHDNEISSSSQNKLVMLENREWIVRQFNLDWAMIQNIAVPILAKFRDRTNGTSACLELPVLSWNYFGADPDWSRKQAAQLTIELEAALARHDVKIVSMGLGSIEIVPHGIDKGMMPKLLLNRLMLIRKIRSGAGCAQLPQFIVAIGDSKSDDRMFDGVYDSVAAVAATTVRSVSGSNLVAAQQQKLAKQQALKQSTPRAFTISVGKLSCTKAESYLKDCSEVEKLLQALAWTTEAVANEAAAAADEAAEAAMNQHH